MRVLVDWRWITRPVALSRTRQVESLSESRKPFTLERIHHDGLKLVTPIRLPAAITHEQRDLQSHPAELASDLGIHGPGYQLGWLSDIFWARSFFIIFRTLIAT